MNKLIERNGPRLGLLITAGFEDTILIGRASQWADGIPIKYQRNIARIERPEPLIPKQLIVGVRERIDSTGTIVRPLDEDHLREQVQYLVDAGVRGFVVSLLWSFLNPAHEQRVRRSSRRSTTRPISARCPCSSPPRSLRGSTSTRAR